jgi:transmembrane sensor
MEPSIDIDPIIIKYIREEILSREEAALLRLWLSGAEDREEMLRRVKEDTAWIQANLAQMQHTATGPIWDRVESRLRAEGYWLPDAGTAALSPAYIPMTSTPRRRWAAYVVAAAVVLLVGSSAWWVLAVHRHPAPGLVSGQQQPSATDVQPGGNKANLDSSANGVLAAQGNMKVSKLSDGQLAYNKSTGSTELPQPLAYNSLTTPRAGQFTLTLPDGTRVWLNNASTLRYPVSFTGADRPVELTGEAYFEVARDPAHPFRVIVHKGDGATAEGGSIEVLGTSFNIMAYNDEPAERTTLVDGSIKFNLAHNSVLLRPEQQSVLDAHGAVTVVQANVREVTAWKNGYFHFDHASLQTTMRQLARWYDVDVTYQGHLGDQEFMGKIQRSLPLSAVLKGLENDKVHFKLEGRELTVMP